MTSNNIAREQAHNNGDNHTAEGMDASKYGFPFKDMKCHSTFGRKQFKKEPLSHMHDNGTVITIDYNEEKSPFGTIGKGFINSYDGEGYVKIIELNMSDPNFFQDTFNKEIYKTDWYGEDEGALMIVIEFLILNTNIEMLAKKSFVIEFLEAGPITNIEHQVKITNLKLIRFNFQYVSTIISICLGVGLCFLSFIDIKQENEELLN